MGTTSTIVTVKQRIVTLLSAALSSSSPDGGQVPVTYAWPGPNTGREAVFLGRHPELDDIRVDSNHDIPTMVAGRKQRQEDYNIPVTVWTFRPDLDASAAETCEVRAFVLMDEVEDVLADDPTLGLNATTNTINWARTAAIGTTLFPFERGWACELIVQLNVNARLQ